MGRRALLAGAMLIAGAGAEVDRARAALLDTAAAAFSCRLCEEAAERVTATAAALKPSEFHEDRILEVIDRTCDSTAREGMWVRRLDIVAGEQGTGRLRLVNRTLQGRCSGICRALERQCALQLGADDGLSGAVYKQARSDPAALLRRVCGSRGRGKGPCGGTPAAEPVKKEVPPSPAAGAAESQGPPAAAAAETLAEGSAPVGAADAVAGERWKPLDDTTAALLDLAGGSGTCDICSGLKGTSSDTVNALFDALTGASKKPQKAAEKAAGKAAEGGIAKAGAEGGSAAAEGGASAQGPASGGGSATADAPRTTAAEARGTAAAAQQRSPPAPRDRERDHAAAKRAAERAAEHPAERARRLKADAGAKRSQGAAGSGGAAPSEAVQLAQLQLELARVELDREFARVDVLRAEADRYRAEADRFRGEADRIRAQAEHIKAETERLRVAYLYPPRTAAEEAIPLGRTRHGLGPAAHRAPPKQQSAGKDTADSGSARAARKEEDTAEALSRLLAELLGLNRTSVKVVGVQSTASTAEEDAGEKDAEEEFVI